MKSAIAPNITRDTTFNVSRTPDATTNHTMNGVTITAPMAITSPLTSSRAIISRLLGGRSVGMRFEPAPTETDANTQPSVPHPGEINLADVAIFFNLDFVTEIQKVA
jgi:hypothetical protein